LGIFTESALRFERGVDAHLQEQAMQRATQLIIDICGGQVGPIVEAKSEENVPQAKTITLTAEKLQRVLGFSVEAHRVKAILQGLHMQVEQGDSQWKVTAPTSRFDMEIEEDLIEEIVRLIGYDKMPSENLFGDSVIMQLPEAIISNNHIKAQLSTLGYTEAINYSFVSQKQLDTLNVAEGAIALKNPLTEEFAIMRTSLLPGMLETIKYNLRRQNDSLKMFESGHIFHRYDSIIEDEKLIAICTGKRHVEHWGLGKENVNFFDIKGDLENLLVNTKSVYSFAQSSYDYLHPGRQAEVVLDGKNIGWIGQVHPEICRKIGIKKEVYAFELFIKNIQETQLPVFADISKFPSVRRDIAMVVSDKISYQQILDIITTETKDLLKDVFVFDEYQGDSIGEGKRSLAVGIVLQQINSTFEDKEVDKLMSKMVSSLKENLSVEIRGQ
jgi:phenylalanyl-tRNA synthetase beta chain